jgi:predicted MFS family arabinose efflux permease
MTSRLPAPLRRRTFRRLAAALAASQIGDWLYNVALAMVVIERTGSATWIALTTAARVLPIVALGPLGGVLADRFDRRRLMIASDAVRAAVMVALWIVAVAALPIALAPLLAALATAAGSAYPPAVAASTPRLVPDAELPAANALRSAIGAGGVVAGPAAGALLVALASPAAAFLANAGTFLLSAVLVASLRTGPAFAPGQSRPSVLADLRAGAAALRGAPPVVVALGADVAVSAVYGAQTVLLVVLGRELGGRGGYGLLIAAIGAGGLAGAALGGRAAARRSGDVLPGALLAVAASIALLGLSPSLPVAMALAAAGGTGSIMVEVLSETRMQRLLDEAVFARAYGLALPTALAGIVAGALLAAPLAALLGPAGALAALGAAVAVYAGLVALNSSWMRLGPNGHSRSARAQIRKAATPAARIASENTIGVWPEEA